MAPVHNGAKQFFNVALNSIGGTHGKYAIH